ncbi:MAG: hypothetical protein FWE20_10885 [Defluviitaleaceae bacterium]|nr:hypothetical protein [Defluviitaleaceae bacterium]
MADKTRLSVPKVRKVCGYEIRKMPIGRYLEAIDEISEFPNELIGACFPDMELKEIIERMTAFDEKTLRACIANVFTRAPRHAVGFVAKLTDIEADKLLHDENIGLDGLVDIVDAFIEVNNLGKFLAGLTEVSFKLRKARTEETPGFKDLLRQV